MKKHRYFVSYAYGDDSALGFGAVELARDQPVTGIRDVTAMAKAIESGGVDRVTVISFQEFRDAD